MRMVAATEALKSPVEAGEPVRAKMRVHAYMQTSNMAPIRARIRFRIRFAFFMMIKSFLYRTVYRKI